MKINTKALKETLKQVCDNIDLKVHTLEQVEEFVIGSGSLDIFDKEAKEELSQVFWGVIEPCYEALSGGQKIPNIFAGGAEEEEINYGG